MSHCTDYTVLHENELGKVGYCYGCESYHLRMSGLLSVVSNEQLYNIENNLENMKLDLEANQDTEGADAGVQIKITNCTFLCLSYSEVVEGLELIKIGKYMRNVHELML